MLLGVVTKWGIYDRFQKDDSIDPDAGVDRLL